MASGARPPSNQRSESVPSKSKVRNLNGIDKNSSEKFSPNDESFPEVVSEFKT